MLNLGSPDSTSVDDVRTYLKEFLLDPRVIDSNALVRNFVVRCMILPSRPKHTAAAYAKIWTTEGSPLVATSKHVADKVQEDIPVHIELAMRYGNPSIANAIKNLKKKGITRLFVIPLYPHYAISSTETVIEKVKEEIQKQAPEIKWESMPPFYKDDDYITALAESVRPYLEKDYDKLLFSYHGIPEHHIHRDKPLVGGFTLSQDCCTEGDDTHNTCYRHHCFETTKALVAKLNIPKEKHFISFQSRLGRKPWLKPFTDHTLEKFPAQGVKKLLVICPSFVTDCLETLEEINMEGRSEFLKAGGEFFDMIPCMNEHPAWITTLSKRINDWL